MGGLRYGGQVGLESDEPEAVSNKGCVANPKEAIVFLVSIILIVALLPLSLLVTIKMVPTHKEHEKAVIFRMGRPMKTVGPGLIFIVPCMDQIKMLPDY